MKRMNLRKILGATAVIGATIMTTNALAAPPQGAHSLGYGMMGGYGAGPAMMDGYESNYGMGPGMMGNYRSGYGMGPGMMGSYGAVADLNLSTEQRGKIAKIQNDIRRKHWELMGNMQDEQSQMNELYYAENRDEAALSKSYRKMSELRHQMFDSSLDAQRQIDVVLTKEQRDKLKRGR